MFYRIKNDALYDYSDVNYALDCIETNIVTQSEIDKYPNKVIVQNGVLVINPNFDEEELEKAKELKYQEANNKAKIFLEGGNATFEISPNIHIEASKENMNTFASASIAIERGLIPYQEWTSKEDVKCQFSAEECLMISMGIGAIQSAVWNTQYLEYKREIDDAQSIEDIDAITIEYQIVEIESEGE